MYFLDHDLIEDNITSSNIKIKQIINLPDNIAMMEIIGHEDGDYYEDTALYGNVGLLALTHVDNDDGGYDAILPYELDGGDDSGAETAIRARNIFVPTALCPKCHNKMIVCSFKQKDGYKSSIRVYCRICKDYHNISLKPE